MRLSLSGFLFYLGHTWALAPSQSPSTWRVPSIDEPLIDLRQPSDFARCHVAGATSIPVEQLEVRSFVYSSRLLALHITPSRPVPSNVSSSYRHPSRLPSRSVQRRMKT